MRRILGRELAQAVAFVCCAIAVAAGMGCTRSSRISVNDSPNEIRNSIGMDLVRLPPGEFWMGSDESIDGLQPDGPRHQVEISREFWIGKYEVSQSEYQRIMDANPNRFCADGDCADAVKGIDTPRFPADHVSWEEAVEFCRRLSALPEEKRAGRRYRLPTEAEWEYACRSGSETAFAFGDSLDATRANISAPTNGILPPSRPVEVGSYPANAWGLYDMHGNVWEWCRDGRRKFPIAAVVDPRGGEALAPMLRGGAWDFPAEFARCHHRQEALRGYVFFGFRVLCTVNDAPSADL